MAGVEGRLLVLEGLPPASARPGTLLTVSRTLDTTTIVQAQAQAQAQTAVVLSHREPATAFALVVHDGPSGAHGVAEVEVGDAASAVAPAVRFGVLVDGAETQGRVVDGLSHAQLPRDGDSSGFGQLFNTPPTLDELKPVYQPLLTGVSAIDLLTPLGRGQTMLLCGEVGAKLTELACTAVNAQRAAADRGSGRSVRCIYAAVGVGAAEHAESSDGQFTCCYFFSRCCSCARWCMISLRALHSCGSCARRRTQHNHSMLCLIRAQASGATLQTASSTMAQR